MFKEILRLLGVVGLVIASIFVVHKIGEEKGQRASRYNTQYAWYDPMEFRIQHKIDGGKWVTIHQDVSTELSIRTGVVEL